MHQVKADTAIPAGTFKVAFQLTAYWFWDNPIAYRSCQTVAEAVGVSEATVIRALHLLHDRGHLNVQWGTQGRGHPNRYSMILKPAPVQVLKDGKPAPAQVRKPASVSRKPAPVQENPSFNHTGEPKGSPSSGEREEALTRSLAASGGGTLEASPPESEESKRKPRKEEGKTGAVIEILPPVNQAAMIALYGELRRIWVRPYIDDEGADRRAFALACREAQPEALLRGAREWVQEADHPRYLPSLTKWLGGRGWEKAPPRRRQQQQTRRYSGGRIDLQAGMMAADDMEAAS